MKRKNDDFDYIAKSLFNTAQNKSNDGMSEVARFMKDTYDAFVFAGFSDEQAMELLKIIFITVCGKE